MKPHLAIPVSVLALLTSLDLSAQTQNTVFLGDGNASTGSSNTFPWSAETLRYQTIFPGSLFSTTGTGVFIINDVLVAPQLTVSPAIRTAVYDDIEIRMGATAQVSPTTTWSTNNPNPTVVYRGPLRVTFEKGVWRGLGLPKSFTFIQTTQTPNLCVEFIMWKFTSDTARRADTTGVRSLTDTSSPAAIRAFRNSWTTNQSQTPLTGTSASKMGLVVNSGNFVPTEVGNSCSSSGNTKLAIGSSTFPQAGKDFAITLTGALPSSSALLAIGTSDVLGFGGSLPLNAVILGAPGCFVWNEDKFLVGAACDNTGAAKLSFKLPSGLGNMRAYCHWWNIDKNANSLGVTTSDYGKILMGN